MTDANAPQDGIPASPSPSRVLLKQLIAACGSGDIDEARRLIAAGAPINEIYSDMHANNSPLFAAAISGNVEMAAMLLNAGADVNFKPREPLFWTPLIVAADNGHLEMVRFFLERGADALAHADPDVPSTNARFYAKNKRNPALMELLENAEREQRKQRKSVARFVPGLADAESNGVLMFVRADLDAVAQALINVCGGGSRRQNVLGKSVALGLRDYALLTFRGCKWTMVGGLTLQTLQDPVDAWAQRCSADLSTAAIIVCAGDDPSVLSYRLWGKGREVESYEFSADAVIEQMGEPSDEDGDPRTIYRDLVRSGAGSTFRSDRRTVERVTDPRAFVDAFAKEQGIYIPAIDTGRGSEGGTIQFTLADASPNQIERGEIVSLVS